MTVVDFIKKHLILIITVFAMILGFVLVYSGNRGAGREVSGDEKRIKEIVESLDCVSDVTVLLNTYEDGMSAFGGSEKSEKAVAGIAVTAKGAESPKVQEKIIRLLAAAYSIPTNRIFVCGKQ